MKYEVLYINDNGTAKVRMTIDNYILEQDFEIENLDENVKQGMAIFKAEIDRISTVKVDDSIVGKSVSVKVLPTIPATDFEPEQPESE